MTHQPEFFLFRELALLFARERVPVLSEVFVDLLVHVLLLGREFRRPSISFRLRRGDGDIVYGGHDREWRWEGAGRSLVSRNGRFRYRRLHLNEYAFPFLSSVIPGESL